MFQLKNYLADPSILTYLIPGRFSSMPNTGTRRRKLIATGKNPLKLEYNCYYVYESIFPINKVILVTFVGTVRFRHT